MGRHARPLASLAPRADRRAARGPDCRGRGGARLRRRRFLVADASGLRPKEEAQAQEEPQARGRGSGADAGPGPGPIPSGQASSGPALNNQGYSLIQAGKYTEAVPILQKAVQSFPAGTSDINYQYALFNLGHALRLAGRPAEAVPVLEQRLQYPDQRDKVKAELKAARKAAGQG
jgi:serine/threonine-protein kinase